MTQAIDSAGDYAASVSRAVGAELRRARDAAGLTREQLVAVLPMKCHVQTLAAYERGTTPLTTARLAVFCKVLGVSTPQLVALAFQRADLLLHTSGILVDLHAVLRQLKEGPLVGPLHRWAGSRLANGGTGVVQVPWTAIEDLAAAFGTTRAELTQLLVTFTPERAQIA